MLTRPSGIRQSAMVLVRAVQLAIGAGVGSFAMFWTSGEIKRASAAATLGEQILGTLIFAGTYLGIAYFATRDLRVSSLLASVIAVLTTPVYGFIWLSSQWTPQSSQKAIPLLWAIGANVILFAMGVIGALLSLPKRLQQGR
jgi:hypothetical protein